MMDSKTIYMDYLAHYGVKGMKWGVRHGPERSMRGNFHRGLSKIYGLNERTYRKLGNNTLASMNSTEKTRQLKKAEALDKEKQSMSSKQRAQQRAKIKKAAIIGGAVVAAGLVAYGGYKLSVTRQFNQASIAKFLNSRSDIGTSVIKGGSPYKYSGAKATIGGGSYNTTRISTGKIHNSIKGPTLKATRSTTVSPGGPEGFLGGKQLEQYLIGNKGRKSLAMSKKDRKYWASVYRKYYK